jgi:hypothetical protein
VSTEQEYDAQSDMVDDQDPSESSGPGPYPESFPARHQMNQQPPLNQHQQLGQQQHGLHMSGTPQGYHSMTQLLDPYDPMLDMDPFGLSASMQQFPTQFSFDTSSMR